MKCVPKLTRKIVGSIPVHYYSTYERKHRSRRRNVVRGLSSRSLPQIRCIFFPGIILGAHLHADTFDERAIKNTHRKNNKTTCNSGTAESERAREKDGGGREFDLSMGLRRSGQSVFKVPKQRTSPIPFPLVVHVASCRNERMLVQPETLPHDRRTKSRDRAEEN